MLTKYGLLFSAIRIIKIWQDDLITTLCAMMSLDVTSSIQCIASYVHSLISERSDVGNSDIMFTISQQFKQLHIYIYIYVCNSPVISSWSLYQLFSKLLVKLPGYHFMARQPCSKLRALLYEKKVVREGWYRVTKQQAKASQKFDWHC